MFFMYLMMTDGPFMRQTDIANYMTRDVCEYKPSRAKELNKQLRSDTNKTLRTIRKRLVKKPLPEGFGERDDQNNSLKFAIPLVEQNDNEPDYTYLALSTVIHGDDLRSNEWRALDWDQYQKLAFAHPVFNCLTTAVVEPFLKAAYDIPDPLNWKGDEHTSKVFLCLIHQCALIGFVSVLVYIERDFPEWGRFGLRFSDFVSYVHSDVEAANWLDFILECVTKQKNKDKITLKKDLAIAYEGTHADGDRDSAIRQINRWLKSNSEIETKTEYLLLEAFKALEWDFPIKYYPDKASDLNDGSILTLINACICQLKDYLRDLSDIAELPEGWESRMHEIYGRIDKDPAFLPSVTGPLPK